MTVVHPHRLAYPLQVPFTVCFIAASTGALCTVSNLRGSVMVVAGMVLAIIALGGSFVRKPVAARFAIEAVPFLSIVAVGLARSAMLPYIPAIGMLCLFPFTWVAYTHRWRGLPVIVVGGVFISCLPLFLGTQPTNTPYAWVNIITLPLISTIMSVGICLGINAFDKAILNARSASQEARVASEAVVDHQTLLRSIIESFDGAVTFYGTGDRLLLANRAAKRMADLAGFTLDEAPFSGPHVRAADRDTLIPGEEQTIPRALNGEQVPAHLEWIGPEGEQIAILASARRLERADGTLLGTVLVAHDVTELAEAIDVRDRFLATVSHELRTPLTAILGYSELALDSLDDDPGNRDLRSHLEAVLRNGDSLLASITLLLNAGERVCRAEKSLVDLTALVSAACAGLTAEFADAELDVSTDLESDIIVQADAHLLRLALDNVLTNAIKFTHAGGSILVRLEANEVNVLISVEDSGVGMTPDEQRQALNRFFRARNARENAIRGLGLGLALTRTAISAHEGAVRISSTPGSGTTVTLMLPR